MANKDLASLQFPGLSDTYIIPKGATATPLAPGTAAVGVSDKFAREDHVHPNPTFPVTSVNGQTGAVSLSIPSSASDVGAVALSQGVGHAGEFLVVGSNGNVTTVTLSTWQGGSY